MPVPFSEAVAAALRKTYLHGHSSLVHAFGQADGDEFGTELGDIKEPGGFFPQVKVLRWGNEANFSVRLVEPEPAVGLSVDPAGRLVYAASSYDVRLYDRGLEPGGGFELDMVLRRPPASNVVRFTVRHKGLRFHYQPPLPNRASDGSTWARSASGGPTMLRPANVGGSYAAYHAEAKHDLRALGGQNYRAGKAFHLYRPHVQDAQGRTAWCDLRLELTSGELLVEIPQAFLDGAVYPLLLDPTFGYTTNGASTDSNSNTPCYFYAGSTPASSGNTSIVTTRVGTDGAADNVDVAIYSNSAGTANARLGATEPGASYGAGAALANLDSTLVVAVTSGVQYWLALREHAGGAMKYAFDATGINGGHGFQYEGTAGAFPATAANGGQFDEEATIFATFAGTSAPSMDWLDEGRPAVLREQHATKVVASGAGTASSFSNQT